MPNKPKFKSLIFRAPGWLSWVSLCLPLRSWSQNQAACSAGGGYFSLCLCPCSISLTLSQINKILKKTLIFKACNILILLLYLEPGQSLIIFLTAWWNIICLCQIPFYYPYDTFHFLFSLFTTLTPPHCP